MNPRKRKISFRYFGTRSKRVGVISLALGLIFLTSISGILPVLPTILSNFLGPNPIITGSSSANTTATSVLPESPGVPLSAGTVSYGTNARPTISQAVDSAVPPHLFATNDAFVYQTSFGLYSFNRSIPFVFSVSSRGQVPLTKAGFFFVNSTVPLTPGSAFVTQASDTEFQVQYQVRSSVVNVGNLNLTVNYQTSVKPKFTIIFSKSPNSILGDFNIVWYTFTMQNWFRQFPSSSTLDVQNYQSLHDIANVTKGDTGPSSDSSVWTDWLTTDWTDAGSGILRVGPLNILGRIGYGHEVVFSKNVGLIDPTQVATSTATFATGYSTQRKNPTSG